MQTTSPAPGDRLPRLRPDLRGTPFQEGLGGASGKHLVEAGDACYLLSADAWAAVEVMADEPATLGELGAEYTRRTGNAASLQEMHALVWERLPRTLFADTPAAPSRPPFLFHRRLLPAGVVEAIARRLAWLYTPWVVACVVLLFVASLVLSFVAAPASRPELTPGEVGALVALVLASMLVHELGHATACARFGCPSGEVGWGVYVYLPMMYTDVTRAWRLSPRQRAVVDLGGLYFQALVVPLMVLWAWRTESHTAQRLVWINVYMMLHALNPMFKMDGYWLLTDLSGLTNLHRRTGTALRNAVARLAGASLVPVAETDRVRSAVLHTYAVLCVAYFAFVAHMLSTSAPRLLAAYPATAARHLAHVADAAGPLAAAGSLVALLAATVPLAIVCLAGYFLSLRAAGLLAAVVRFAARRLRGGPRPTPHPSTAP
jgi:putative peptide zinc metalloprotease protein